MQRYDLFLRMPNIIHKNTWIVSSVPFPHALPLNPVSPVHCRSKTVHYLPFLTPSPFTIVQRVYGRTSKQPMDVRLYTLRTYVHRTFERTSIERYNAQDEFC